jgi:signal transduction histidine kinase
MVSALAAFAIALSFAGGLLVVMFKRHMDSRLAHELDLHLIELAALVSFDARDNPILTRQPAYERYRTHYSGAYWQISVGDTIILRSKSLFEAELTLADATRAAGREDHVVNSTGPDGLPIHLAARTITYEHRSGPKTLLLAVAEDDSEAEEYETEFAGDVAMALAAIAVLLLFATWAHVNIGLAPLVRLRRNVEDIRTGRLTRLPGDLPSELRPLVDDLNQLLDRQDQLIERSRNRAGNLAHGLKTPLTVLRGEARRLEDEGRRDTARTIVEQIITMNTHVERELSRARIHGLSVGGTRQTDASGTLERLVGLAHRVHDGPELDWIVECPEGLRLRMDVSDFGEIAGNLIDNARKWADRAVRIRVGYDDHTECATLAFEDDGPGIPKEKLDDVLNRGVRLDERREGSGLGLGIVQDILAEYGTELRMDRSPLGGCRASFTVPAVLV